MGNARTKRRTVWVPESGKQAKLVSLLVQTNDKILSGYLVDRPTTEFQCGHLAASCEYARMFGADPIILHTAEALLAATVAERKFKGHNGER